MRLAVPSKRRAKGEGSIVQRLDGTWQFSIGAGVDEHGKRRRRYLYASTRSALLRKIQDEKARTGGSIKSRSALTVREWVEAWLASDVKPNVSKNSYSARDIAWRLHAGPLVGQKRLDRFDADDVALVYAELRRLKIGGRSVQLVAETMRAAFDAAIRRDKYHGVNPWRKINTPRHTPKETRSLDAAEARRFIDAARGSRFEALWLLGLTAGLRIGEALGLTWQDVDFEAGQVNIRQQSTEVGGRVAIGPLKTKSSRRVLDVGATTLGALKRRKKASDKEGHGSPLVFTTPAGDYLSRTYLRRLHFKPICKKAEVNGLTIHGLRHSMTSNAIASGISPVVVAARLGHSSTRMTLDRYAHLLPGQQREAARTIDAAFGLARAKARPKSARKTGKVVE